MFFFYAGLRRLLYLEYLMHIFAVNVALDKPAYMQYQYKPGDNRYDASNAVDGQKSNLSFNGGQCSSSVASKQTATWWVNLTKIYNIHHIRIYFLKSKYEWGMVIFNCCPLITYTSSKLYSLVSFRNILFLRLCMTSNENTTFLPKSHFTESQIREQCTKLYKARIHYEIQSLS